MYQCSETQSGFLELQYYQMCFSSNIHNIRYFNLFYLLFVRKPRLPPPSPPPPHSCSPSPQSAPRSDSFFRNELRSFKALCQIKTDPEVMTFDTFWHARFTTWQLDQAQRWREEEGDNFLFWISRLGAYFSLQWRYAIMNHDPKVKNLQTLRQGKNH